MQDTQRFGELPSEDELIVHFVVPLLRAFGWPPERIAVKWRYVDVAVFRSLPRTPENCQFVIEAKRLGAGVEGALEQAQGYAIALGITCNAVVTDGIRYRMYDGARGYLPLAYANLTRLKRPAADLFSRVQRPYVPLALKDIPNLPHAFEPARTPLVLRQYEKAPDWKLPSLADRYPRCSTDRETAETEKLEWVTPGHPLFEAMRRHSFAQSMEVLGKGATYYSLQHQAPARLDFYRARVVDGLGHVVHERLFAVETSDDGESRLQEPAVLGNFVPATPPQALPPVALRHEPVTWLHEQALAPFLEDTRGDRLAEIERVAVHVEMSLTELIQRADEEIGKAASDVDQKLLGSEGRLAMAEARHSELLARRERRRMDLERQRALTLQSVERLASVLVLPHPDREAPEVRRLRPDFETEMTAMRVVMEHERQLGRQVYDVSDKNLGYDITSLDLASGELRLIEVKGIGASTGTVLLTPNERRVAEDRRDCFWLYVVTDCNSQPQLEEPIRDPARLDWHEVTKVAHYYLSINAMTRPMQVREEQAPFEGQKR